MIDAIVRELADDECDSSLSVVVVDTSKTSGTPQNWCPRPRPKAPTQGLDNLGQILLAGAIAELLK